MASNCQYEKLPAQPEEREHEEPKYNQQIPKKQQDNNKKITRRIHKLAKLLNDIKQLKSQRDHRKRLLPNQIAKIKREAQYQNELNELRYQKEKSTPRKEKYSSQNLLQLLEHAEEEEIYNLHEKYDLRQTSRTHKLQKKLKQIDELKKRKNCGQSLVPNQVAKINEESKYLNELIEIKQHEQNECNCPRIAVQMLWEEIFKAYNCLLEIGHLKRQKVTEIALTKEQLELIDREELFLMNIKVLGQMYEKEIIEDFMRKTEIQMQQQLKEFRKQQQQEVAEQLLEAERKQQLQVIEQLLKTEEILKKEEFQKTKQMETKSKKEESNRKEQKNAENALLKEKGITNNNEQEIEDQIREIEEEKYEKLEDLDIDIQKIFEEIDQIEREDEIDRAFAALENEYK